MTSIPLSARVHRYLLLSWLLVTAHVGTLTTGTNYASPGMALTGCEMHAKLLAAYAKVQAAK